jgi:NitT/TauT family transport system permease protein
MSRAIRMRAAIAVGVVFAMFLGGWIAVAQWSHPGYRHTETGELQRDTEGRLVPAGVVLVPGPIAVVEELYNLFAVRKFHVDVYLSVKRVTLGLGSSLLPGFVLGVILGLAPRSRAAVGPLFAFIQYIPPVAFVPMLILWFGIGLSQQVALLFIGTFFYFTVMVAESVAGVPSSYHDAARTLGTGRAGRVFRVAIPHSMPDVIQHARVMVGIAWTYLTVVEIVSADAGIGSVIINSQRYLQTPRVFAGLITIGALGILSDLLLRGLSRLLCRWKH